MKKILIVIGSYLPGYKVGGPIQSIKGFTWLLKDKYDIRILTQNRDYKENKEYDVETKKWYVQEETKVMYVKPDEILSEKFLKTHLQEENYDLIYLQGYFSNYTRKILLLKYIKKIIKQKIMIAPRGEFGDAALRKGNIKKKLYIKLLNILNINKKITWHATNQQEKKEIENITNSQRIYTLNNIKKYVNIKKNIYESNVINFIFISRIVEHKNLYFFLEILSQIKIFNKKVNFHIFGPIEDLDYWKKCEIKIEKIKKNENINIIYCGSLNNNEVVNKIKEYHYLVLPTKGENYGHILVESFMAKTPVLISDKTPWKDLTKLNIGYDLSLEDKILWIKKLEEILNENMNAYLEKVNSIEKFNKQIFSLEKEKNMYEKFINEIIGG